MTDSTPDPERLAELCSSTMHAQDFCAQALGMEIISSIPGRAVLQMRVRRDMVNGHAICHGGMIFTLADTAFAHACNNTNRNTVASGCTIDFLASGKLDDVMTALAEERSRGGKTGVYDITVTNQDGALLALFRGKSYQIRGGILDDEGEPA